MSTRHFVLFATVIGVMMASLIAAITTMTLAPMNVKATTQEDEDNDDRDGDGALTQTITKTRDGEERLKNIESNENSENAAVKLTQSKDHEVNTDRDDDARDDEPALTLERTRTVKDGEVTEETKESSEKSSKAPNLQIKWFIDHGCC
jgi:hypothetical protein